MATQSLNLSLERASNYEEFHDLMPKWGYAASAFVLFLIGFFGFFLNLLVIILMFKDKQLWTPMNLILFNMVCSDFSVSVLGNPFTLISALYHRWVFGKTMCVIYGFFMTLLGITSITTLTVLSFERYIMVSRPLASHRLSMRGAYFSVLMIWCYSFAVTTPPLIGWGSYVNEAANISCSINWEEQTFNALTYILFLFAMGLIIPVFVITFSYMNILKTMKSNAGRMGRVAKAESRVTLMVFLMIVTFMIAWTPYSIFALIEQFAPSDLVSPGMGVIPALVAKSSICYDPIIYVGMNSQYRASVKRLLGFGERHDSTQERAMENTILSPTKAISHTNTNNITLQYLNPNDNTLVALTIYKEDENKRADVRESTIDDHVKSSKGDKKKKITLVTSTFEEESSELSADKEEFTENDDSEYPKTVLVDLATNSKQMSEPIKNDYQTGILKDNGNVESKEYLLGGHNSQYEGFDNTGSNLWEENESQNMLSLSPTKKMDFVEPLSKMSMPSKRKSFAYTSLKFNEDFSDIQKIKDISKRRQSMANCNFSLSHAKKMSSVSFDRGGPVTRLMVDERDRSKLMNLGEFSMKTGDKSYSKGEQLL